MFILVFLALGLNTIFADLKDLNQYINRLPQKSNYSVYVEEINSDKKLLHHEGVKRVPASLTKLAVLGAALDTYPLDWKFKNKILSKSKINNGKIKDPLCFKASGDPSLVSEKMWVLVNDLHRKGLREVPKGIQIDTSSHEEGKRDEGRSKNRTSRAYDAPVGAASFNWNSVNIYIEPTEVGKKAKVYLDPESSYFELKNEIKTVKGYKKNLKHQIRLKRKKRGNQVELNLSGEIGIKNKEELLFRNIRHPNLWTAHHLKAFMKRRGIKVSNKIQIKDCPDYNIVLTETESKSIALIYRDMMKFSNNFVTELVVKNLPQVNGKKASFEGGKKILKKYLNEIGVKDVITSSVSGLSYKNEMTVTSIGKILKNIKNHPYKYEAIQTFPLANIDGTLKNRFSFLKQDQVLRAKTGMLSSAIGLAGFLQIPNKEYLFVAIYNGNKIYPAKSAIDEMIRQLIQ